MGVTAIIQARMNGTRLPGKVLMSMAGKSMLKHVIDRVAEAKLVDKVVVATCYPGGVAIAGHCETWGVQCWCDDNEHDVLRRYIAAAQWCGAKVIVRVCADSPLIKPEGIDELIIAYYANPADYVGYESKPRVPAITQGLGYVAEVTTLDALQRSDKWMASDDKRREHVTQMLYTDERFTCHWLPLPDWYKTIRPKKAAVDTMEDFRRVAAVLEEST